MTHDHSSRIDSPLSQALERLVIVLRETPRAAEVHAELAAAAARLAAALRRSERIEAGVEGSSIAETVTLRGRLLARAVDWLEISPGATAGAMLDLARALASDTAPIPAADGVTVALVTLPRPMETGPVRVAEPGIAGLDAGLGDDDAGDSELLRLTDEVRTASVQRDWHGVLQHAQALLDYAELDTAVRRTRIIQARRALPMARLRELVEHALRHQEDQLATGDVLARIGPDGHQVMVEAVAESESLAARRFLHDQLGRTPEAFPLLVPLLERGTASQARHAAGILARLADERALAPLASALSHQDDAVRAEVLRALARFDHPTARAALLEGLRHQSSSTRIAAAQAVGNAGMLTLAPSVMGVLREEADSSVRRALATAAARLGTVEALEELVRIAVGRKRLLRGGFPVEMRLDVVAGLAAAATPTARRALDRIVREADRVVQRAADTALNVRR